MDAVFTVDSHTFGCSGEGGNGFGCLEDWFGSWAGWTWIFRRLVHGLGLAGRLISKNWQYWLAVLIINM